MGKRGNQGVRIPEIIDKANAMLTGSRVDGDEALDEVGVAAAGNAHSEQTTMKFPRPTNYSKSTMMSSTWFLTRIARAFGMRCGASCRIPSASQVRKGNRHPSKLPLPGGPLLRVPGMPFLSGNDSSIITSPKLRASHSMGSRWIHRSQYHGIQIDWPGR